MLPCLGLEDDSLYGIGLAGGITGCAKQSSWVVLLVRVFCGLLSVVMTAFW